ncbi:MAG: DUF3261 domain-containing protein [Myxococcota bacterium]|jgi:hypothetical protein|nr:DUF3261 domain-containing protein [Myxococcota bacterium]
MCRATLALLATALAGCAAGPPSGAAKIPDAAIPGTLRPVGDMPGAFLWQQEVVAHFQGRTHRFEAALQKHDTTLRMIGLTPYRSKAFVATLDGESLSWDVLVEDAAIPIPPKAFLLDVQRVYFPIAAAPPGGEGPVTTERDGERVTETWRGGRLASRRFERLDGEPPGEVVISYDAWEEDTPTRIRLDNGWFRYRLEVTTVARKDLSK